MAIKTAPMLISWCVNRNAKQEGKKAGRQAGKKAGRGERANEEGGTKFTGSSDFAHAEQWRTDGAQ